MYFVLAVVHVWCNYANQSNYLLYVAGIMSMSDSCPICNTLLLEQPLKAGGKDATKFTCPRCGHFVLTRTLIATLPHTLASNPDASAKLSHALRRAQEVNPEVCFSTSTIEEVLLRPLPRPQEQADLLVRWLALNIPGPGEYVELSPKLHAGIVGAKSDSGFVLVLNHLFAVGLLTGLQYETMGEGRASATLSFKGWAYYEDLAKGSVAYRKAFMAMKFGDPVLEGVLRDVFKPAVKLVGFDLFKLDDVPKAGLIDDRLRVEIQSSDFLVADLTHDNLGAYWEAGYAEGLGKPVIYTCERSKFEATKTHFDTNHHLTIVWDSATPEPAAEALKATIRATLPHLAKQRDGGV